MNDDCRKSFEEMRVECTIIEEMLLTLDRRVRMLQERSTGGGWLSLKINELQSTRRAALEQLVSLRGRMSRLEAEEE